MFQDTQLSFMTKTYTFWKFKDNTDWWQTPETEKMVDGGILIKLFIFEIIVASSIIIRKNTKILMQFAPMVMTS